MRILIIGDNPNVTGGVCNYTRPLFKEFQNNSLSVMYLYSASRLKADYRLFTKTKIENDQDFKDKNVFKIINSVNLDMNYDNLILDSYSEENDKVFEDFILENKINIIHINEIIGFSSNIINIANKYDIKVVVTVHEYWWLCPKRVMVDFNRKICVGPEDFAKCSFCIENISNNYSSKSRKRSYLIHNQFKLAHDFYTSGRKFFSKEIKLEKLDKLTFDDKVLPAEVNKNLELNLEKRLRSNIFALNNCDLIIGVSQDVKDHLIKYGVNAEKILVQHIGSTIAEQHIYHEKSVDYEKIVFGFIGGVSYYKGVHQMVEAYINMPDEYKKKSKLEIFGKYNDSYKNSVDFNILKNKKFSENVTFYGRYKPSEIKDITNKIDLVILPSLCADTAPQTIFESFSSELPIIAPKVGGFPDFIKDKYNGLIYNASDVKSLTEKLMYIIDNPQIIDKMRLNIPKLKKISENAKELQEIYSGLI